MPKKPPTNPKAQAARERKQEQKNAIQEKVEREKDDAHWADSDKHLERKQKRKENKEQKRTEVIQKKHEAKQLLKEEEANLVAKPSPKPAKVSQVEISRRQGKEREKQQKELAAKAAEDDPIELFEGENPNRKMAELLLEDGAVEARNVEDAISALNVDDKKKDKYPEKRLRAAYVEYEKRELPKLKKENPKLRLTQLKEILWKEWMKSPENPMNQM